MKWFDTLRDVFFSIVAFVLLGFAALGVYWT